MKSRTIYRITLGAMFVVTIFMAIGIVLTFNLAREMDEPVSFWNVSFPLIGLIVTPFIGIVFYIKKKPLGWIFCCGYAIFLLVLLSLYYFDLSQMGGASMEGMGGMTASFIVMSAVLVSLIVLLLTDKMRALFFPGGQDKLLDTFAMAFVVAITIGLIVFTPRLVALSHHIVWIIVIVSWALRTVVNKYK